jgi:Secretion system C-terminal sorting domain
VLHVVLAEKKISNTALSAAKLALINTGEKGDSSTFEYVVKKMLPSASGTKFTKVLNPTVPADSAMTFPLMNWTPDPTWLYAPSGAAGDMVVIAFLQDEITREVHQAIISPLIPDPVVITAIENPFSFEDVSIYPNPADQQLNIAFPNQLVVDVPIMMFDQMGRITHNTRAKKGEKSATLEIGSVAAGMYILQMDLGNGNISRAKVIVTHRE